MPQEKGGCFISNIQSAHAIISGFSPEGIQNPHRQGSEDNV